MMLMDIARYLERDRGDPVGILVISSVFRDEMPWVYDLGVDTYRAMKSGDAKQAEAALREFREVIEMTLRGPVMELLETTPDTVMVLRETLERISRRYHQRSAERKAKIIRE
jgi:broad-specificity NMP kinase